MLRRHHGIARSAPRAAAGNPPTRLEYCPIDQAPVASMRVGLDAHMVGSHETGNETYVLGLIDGFTATKDVELFVYHAGHMPNVASQSVHLRRLRGTSSWSRLTLDLPVRTWLDATDVFHTTYTAPLWSSCPVILTVLVGPEHFRSELVTAAATDLAGRVHFTGYVSHGQLASLYACARVFAFPSLYEGFGIPALEAMAHGTPVACARAGALPEVCGDAAAYFDPTDINSIAATVKGVMNDGALRERLARAGRIRQSQFTWERAAEETLAVYLDALQEHRIGHTTG